MAITYSNNNDSLVSLDKLSIFKSIIENEIDRKAGQGGGYTKELVYNSGSDTDYAPVSTALNNLDVDVSFNQSISKFDQLVVIYGATQDGGYSTTGRAAFFDVDLLLNSNKPYVHTDYFKRYFVFKVKNSTTFAYYSQADNENNESYRPRIYKIYGIKYGSGTSGNGSSGGITEIPPATYSSLGGIIPDGETITITNDGVITSRVAVAANELTYAETMAILNASS